MKGLAVVSEIKAISSVGSNRVKNHAVALPDANKNQTLNPNTIVGAAFGTASLYNMALSTIPHPQGRENM